MIYSQLFVIFLLVTASACGNDKTSTDLSSSDEEKTIPTEPKEATEPAGTMKMTQVGRYQVWLEFPDTLVRGQAQDLALTVRDANGKPASNLIISVTFIHKAMGHGGNKIPFIQEIGEGKYTISNVAGSMSGTWSLGLKFVEGDMDDLVAYDIEVS